MQLTTCELQAVDVKTLGSKKKVIDIVRVSRFENLHVKSGILRSVIKQT